VTADENFPRATAAGRDRLRGGLGFPIVLAADTLGVLEFFSSQRQSRDKELLKRLAGYGGQIGLFIERRRAEEELRQSQEALRETDRRKDEFLAMLAHELRNPPAPILNSLYILNMPAADPAVAGQAREVIERQVQHLVRLVDDLLDVSRIMRGKIVLRKERLDLSVAIARAVETAQPVIDSRGHRLTVALAPEPIAVDADLVRLAQVIANLLNNAAKYTDPGGEIRLSTERRDGEAVVRVRDTGVGIAADVLPRVFDLFVQADRSLDRAHGGMGVGLTLVRTLVERHGGTVVASSEGVGRGSEFVVRLPLMPERRPEARPPSDDAVLAVRRDPSGQLPARRVLVVDDNADAADSLAILLRMYGQIVRVVHDGMAALEAAQCEPPDVVFLDLGMPGMNGFEVARRLRQQPATENALLVAVTGWGQAEDRRRTHEAGFDHHLVKPVDAGAVQGLLAQAIAPAR
jgi:signal transduction histidine kinase/ActR/RegA family two-component response regulator